MRKFITVWVQGLRLILYQKEVQEFRDKTKDIGDVINELV